ncbi:MAG: glutathione S-transferase family protein [Pseudomonadales bacterium]|nr:glutathione S-transferase family protein [Pseudomonadales bacterium]
MTETYTLYGSYASYYTAKSRSHLRKKGIPFVERLPSEARFREYVRPTSGSHRIPQLLTPNGEVIQDSIEMLDHLEARFPELPAIPATPKQRTFVHLMELLGSEGLVGLAWQHRWLFEENLGFVKADFGRSFRPQGSNEELQKYGNLITERMMSYGLPPTSEAIRADLDEQYLTVLNLLEAHLQHHPYLLGGHPSAADYAIMGAMHAHLGRDPAGLAFMQQHAPRVFRWVEHMLTPEVRSPEFHDYPVAYPAEDEIPATALAFARHLLNRYGGPFVLSSLAFQQAMESEDPAAGHVLDAQTDQPRLRPTVVVFNGSTHEHRADVHAVWIAQRSQRYFQSLDSAAQQQVIDTLASDNGHALLTVPSKWVIERRANRLTVSERL